MNQSKALQLNWTQGATSDDGDDDDDDDDEEEEEEEDDDKGHQVQRKVNWCFSVGA